jgi:SAM-dependent methyltransferase
MKATSLRALGKVGLLRPAYRSYEALRSVARSGGAATDDGVPLPPARLRVQAAGTPEASWFLDSGRAAAETLHAAIARAGTRLEHAGAVFDFGCGCGRVIRHLRGLDAALAGSDFNPALVAWCRTNLPFARFSVNALEPPLQLEAAAFDVVYAFSVLTHLPEALGARWVAELRRIVRPGGLVVLSTHGERYAERLGPSERRTFDAGGLVVRWSDVAGTNLCTAFHPAAYVRDSLALGWDLVELMPEGARGNPHQDLVVLRRPA